MHHQGFILSQLVEIVGSEIRETVAVDIDQDGILGGADRHVESIFGGGPGAAVLDEIHHAAVGRKICFLAVAGDMHQRPAPVSIGDHEFVFAEVFQQVAGNLGGRDNGNPSGIFGGIGRLLRYKRAFEFLFQVVGVGINVSSDNIEDGIGNGGVFRPEGLGVGGELGLEDVFESGKFGKAVDPRHNFETFMVIAADGNQGVYIDQGDGGGMNIELDLSSGNGMGDNGEEHEGAVGVVVGGGESGDKFVAADGEFTILIGYT